MDEKSISFIINQYCTLQYPTTFLPNRSAYIFKFKKNDMFYTFMKSTLIQSRNFL